MRVGIVTGEASGDLLAASMVRAMRERHPDAIVEGVTGPALAEAGCRSLADASELAVMGIFEVLRHLPRLFRLRARLLEHWRRNPPDLFIGVDAPDFNLGLERRIRAIGVPTVHFVSPTVWAWRAGRVHTVAAAADLVLCLYPFEPECYRGVDIRAEFVGHPFAQECARVPDKAACRAALGIDADASLLALLPGSRLGELRRTGAEIAAAAAWLRERMPELRFAVPAATDTIAAGFAELCADAGIGDCTTIHRGRAREVLRAADTAIVTSGTVTLEAMLLGTPFIATYRTGAATAWLLRQLGLLKVQDVAMPNILAGRRVAPELIQEQAQAPLLGAEALKLLRSAELREAQRVAFAPCCEALSLPTAERAAEAVLSLCAPA